MKYLLAMLTVVCSCDTSSLAEVIVDQEHNGCCIGYILDYPEDYIAQTFTVRNTGQLDGIGVEVSLSGYSHYDPVTDDLYVSLMRTDSLGAPAIDEIIASRTISRSAVELDYAPMTELDFSDANLHVRAEDVLAVALSSSHTYYAYRRDVFQYNWHSRLFNPHPGGAFYIYSPRLYGPAPHLVSDRYEPPRNTRDMGFRVSIDVVPEPTTAAMVAGCLLAVCLASLGRLVSGPARC